MSSEDAPLFLRVGSTLMEVVVPLGAIDPSMPERLPTEMI